MNEATRPSSTAYGLADTYGITLVLLYKRPLIYTQPVRLFGKKLYSCLLSLLTCEATRIGSAANGTRRGKALYTIATEKLIDVSKNVISPSKMGEIGT